MSISPHTSEKLVHQHVLLRDLLRRALALLSSPAIRLIGSMERGKKTAIGFVKAEKCEGTGAVVSIDVFEAGALSWYL